MKLDEMVTAYIQLRDKKSEIRQAADAKIAKIDEVMEEIEGRLLSQFDEQGLDSVRTPIGTAYKTVKTMSSIGDWDSFVESVIATGNTQLLERRCGQKSCAEYLAVNGEPPPGINVRSEVVINVRRS
jgi:hypothetical protein